MVSTPQQRPGGFGAVDEQSGLTVAFISLTIFDVSYSTAICTHSDCRSNRNCLNLSIGKMIKICYYYEIIPRYQCIIFYVTT